jgi:UDP:flavonoid glycosyltransferase YjiC (YdhE family)
MRILFSSTRGAGHVQPLIPYAHALLRRGHEVHVAAPESVDAVLKKEGLTHALFDHPGDEVLGSIWARFRGLSNDEINAMAVREIFAGLNARAALPKLLEVIRIWRPDLIVRESAEFAAAVAADQAGVPHARVAVHNSHSEERILSRAAAPVDVLRKEAGVAPDNGAALRAAPAFTAFPAALDGIALHEGSQPPFRVRGPRDKVSPVGTPASWLRQDGVPFVYITFGTIAGSTPEAHAVYRAALAAVAALPVRALLTTGPGIEAGQLDTIPANVTVEAWVPQADVLRHASALVCHGGSGTILGGLAAGVPMVVAPLFADQPDNASRIEGAGAGIAVFKPDASSLRAAMERVLADTEMRANARRIADQMAAMPSIDDAIDALLAPLLDANA